MYIIAWQVLKAIVTVVCVYISITAAWVYRSIHVVFARHMWYRTCYECVFLWFTLFSQERCVSAVVIVDCNLATRSKVVSWTGSLIGKFPEATAPRIAELRNHCVSIYPQVASLNKLALNKIIHIMQSFTSRYF